MLGNTANGLFWTYRLLERAENMSRLIETGQRIALTRLNSSDEQWLYVMQTAAVASEYKRYYKDGYDVEVMNFHQRCEALAAQKARAERALKRLKEKEQAQ